MSFARGPLTAAARYRALRGSPFARRQRQLRIVVCPRCEAVWSEHHDAREDLTHHLFLGEAALALFAADTSLPRIVDWTALHAGEDGRAVEVLAALVLRRRPEDLQPGLDAVLGRLAAGASEPTNAAAVRMAALFRIVALIVKRATADDLRPAGVPRPTLRRAGAAELTALRRAFRPREVAGLARLGLNPDTLRHLAFEQAARRGASEPGAALLLIDDLAPLWRALDEPPLDRGPEVPSRAYLLADCWSALEQLRALAVRPATAPVLCMPAGAWEALAARLDPVARLARAARELLRCGSVPPAERARILDEQSLLIPPLLARGARLCEPVLAALRRLRRQLGAAPRDPRDAGALGALVALLHRAEQAALFDEAPPTAAR